MNKKKTEKLFKKMKRLISYLILTQILTISTFDLMDKNLYQDGKEQYELISSYSQLPKYGDCWKNAIGNMKNGCKLLDDQIQTNLAIMFTYCLLKHLKYDLAECQTIDIDDTDEKANLECYEKLKSDHNSFTTFTEFFTHTQNICFFLQNQIWNEKTLELVQESRRTQVNLLQTVNKAVETQQKLIETNTYLQEIINSSALNVQNVLEEFNQQTKTQQMAIFHLFDRLQQIQSYILGEFTLFYSVIFYLFTIIVAYILTSTRRTQSARAGTFILLTSMLLTESIIVSMSKQSNDFDSKFDLFGYNFDLNYNLYSYIWLCRKFYIYLSFLTLVISAYMYCDYNFSNNKLLNEIKNDHNELRTLINEIKMVSSATTSRPLIQSSAVLTAESIKRGYLMDDDKNVCSLSRSCSSSTLCLNSTIADNTFVPSEYNDETINNNNNDDDSFDIESNFENSVACMNSTYQSGVNDTFNRSNASSVFTVYTRNGMKNDEVSLKNMFLK